MNAIYRRLPLAAVLAWAALAAAACDRAPDTPEPMATPVAQLPAASPTTVARRLPTATPTIDPVANPLHPIELDALPGVPVPIGARALTTIPATDDADARVDFALPADTSVEDMSAWFREQMAEHGWEEGEERQDALVFLHGEQLSARHASEGLERSAMVLFDTLSEEADFSVLAEAAKP